MDLPLDMLLKSQGTNDQSMSMTLVRKILPKLLPIAQKQLTTVFESVTDASCADAMDLYTRSLVSKSPSLWALRMLDATAKAPQGLLAGGWAMLGDYDECLATHAPAFRGQHCLLTACFSGDPHSSCAQDHRESPLWVGLAENKVQPQWQGGWLAPLAEAMEAGEGAAELPVHLGVCVPSLCGAADVTAMASRAAQLLLPQAAHTLHLEARSCRVADTPVVGVAEAFALLLMFGLFLIVAASTAYDYATRESKRRRRAWLALAFSAARNGTRLAETEDVRGDALPALAGLRALSVLWVVVHHALLVAMRLPLANGQHYLKELRRPSAVLVTGAFLGLDTLLLLDGLLVAYVFLRRSAAGRHFSLTGHYFSRLARFLPSVALVLFLQSTILLKAGGGPLWNLQPDQQCPETWPYILLQVCNYFRPETVTCMAHAWFLSLEWQLHALAPLALLLVRRGARPAQWALVALVAAGVGARFGLAWANHLHPPWGGYFTQDALQALYFPTHVRFMPYVLGIALGYELHRMKHLEMPTRLSKRAICLMQLSWPVLMFGSLISVHKFSIPDPQPEPFFEALYLALVHTTWALGVAIFVFLAAAEMPTLGVSFLSFGVWRPLSRLAFGVYLLHLPFLNSVIHDTRFALHLSVWRQVAVGLLAFVGTLGPAALLWLALEAPMGRLEALLCAPPKGERKRLANELCDADQVDCIRIPCEIGETKKINGLH